MVKFLETTKGKIKQAVGALIGNEELKREGQNDETNGKTDGVVKGVTEAAKDVKNAVIEAKDAVIEAKDAVKDGVKEAMAVVRRSDHDGTWTGGSVE